MSYIRTYSQKHFHYHVEDPENIYHWSISLQDIAHSLSLLNRYNGHTIRGYSVAEHSVRVSKLCRDRGYDITHIRAALMHDATEAYIGDMPSPLKNTKVGVEFRKYEEKLWEAIATRFRLPKVLPEPVDEVDKEIQAWEMECFMGGTRTPWRPETAEMLFLEEARRLEIS